MEPVFGDVLLGRAVKDILKHEPKAKFPSNETFFAAPVPVPLL